MHVQLLQFPLMAIASCANDVVNAYVAVRRMQHYLEARLAPTLDEETKLYFENTKRGKYEKIYHWLGTRSLDPRLMYHKNET